MIRENIENLTSIWKTVGQYTNSYRAGPTFDFCAITTSDWPNRLWFHDAITIETLRLAMEQIATAPTKLVIPDWNSYQRQANTLLVDAGFVKLTEQTGMYSRLTQTYEVTEGFRIERVATPEQAMRWEVLFKQAFGYRINSELLLPNYEFIHFYTAFHNELPVGTFMLANTGAEIIGIHSVGIIPDMRGKGFAEQLMKHILNQAIEQEFIYATLQASQMGKGLYLKLGFEEQFVLTNYAL